MVKSPRVKEPPVILLRTGLLKTAERGKIKLSLFMGTCCGLQLVLRFIEEVAPCHVKVAAVSKVCCRKKADKQIHFIQLSRPWGRCAVIGKDKGGAALRAGNSEGKATLKMFICGGVVACRRGRGHNLPLQIDVIQIFDRVEGKFHLKRVGGVDHDSA